MITGLNFNNVPIPVFWRKKFAGTRMVKGRKALLVGVCDSKEEKDAMFAQASNGSRKLHIEVRRCITTSSGLLFGIYEVH